LNSSSWREVVRRKEYSKSDEETTLADTGITKQDKFEEEIAGKQLLGLIFLTSHALPFMKEEFELEIK